MTTINLKDFYYWYTQDQFIEVTEEVAEALRASARYEAAYQRRLTRHKAQYSLDCEDGIEYSACLHEPTPQELLDRMELFVHLWNALNSLPEVQGVPGRGAFDPIAKATARLPGSRVWTKAPFAIPSKAARRP